MLRVAVNVPPDEQAIEAMCEALVQLNCIYFEAAAAADVATPVLYSSGVVYRREPLGREQWQTVLDIVRTREADCEDLSAWRVAELRVFEGDPDARVAIVRTPRGSFHAVVERGDGTIEDPSRVLLEQERARKSR